jgi:hypothetical protein
VNAQFRNYAASNGTTPQRVNQETINGILADEGLPRVEIFDEKIRKNGVLTPILPANYAFLLPDPGAGQLGQTMYGVTAEAVTLFERGFIARRDISGAVAVVSQNDDPVQTFTKGAAIALPLLGDPNAHIAANIG